MEAFEILIIILSVVLSIFLIVAIIAVIFVIKLLNKAKKVSEQAEFVAQNVSQLTDSVGRLASGGVLLSALGKAFKKVRRS